MREIETIQTVCIPQDVKVTAKSRIVRVAGKRGILKKSFKHLSLEMEVKNGKVYITKYNGNRKDRAAVRTVASHIENMIKGVTIGFRKKMKAVFAHFPINMMISDKKDCVTIKNFLGEKLERVVKMCDGVSVSQTGNKDEIQIDGNDIEMVGKCAALIHQKCKVKNKDIRKFLDGIYVSEVTTCE